MSSDTTRTDSARHDRVEPDDIDARQHLDIETAVNGILAAAMASHSTDEMLLDVLDIVLSIPWLSLEHRGGIFLAEEGSDTLILQVQRGLSERILRECAHVPFGQCICGMAALTQQTQHTTHIDEEHTHGVGEPPHGHYCAPIVSDGRCLGVLVLYLTEGHVRLPAVDAFLDATCAALATVLDRLRTQNLLAESEGLLATIVDAYDGLMYMCSRDLRVEYMNERFIRLIGHDATGEVCYAAIHDLEDVCPWCTNDTVFAGETVKFEVQMRQDERDYIVVNRPLVHADGRVSKLSMATDITDLKRSQRDLESAVVKLDAALSGVVDSLSATTSQRDPYTALHQERVSRLACSIAREMASGESLIEGLRVAGLLHDIGKIAVPTDILTKPGSLSEMEMGIIRTHAGVGYELIKQVPFDRPVARAVLQHHERLDGSGYPDGLHEDEIIVEARILAVADVVEAVSSHRPYRPARGIDAAVQEIQERSGIAFDADVVSACVEVVRKGGFAP